MRSWDEPGRAGRGLIVPTTPGGGTMAAAQDVMFGQDNLSQPERAESQTDFVVLVLKWSGVVGDERAGPP